MSGAKKVVLGLGMGCGLMVLLCCGGGGVFIYLSRFSMTIVGKGGPNGNGVTVEYHHFSMKSENNGDPKAVTDMATSMTDITVPEGLKPVNAFSMEMPVLGHAIPSWVLYQDKQAGATLILAQSKVFESQPQANTRQTMQQMMGPMFQQQGMEFPSHELAEKNKEIDTHVCTIRGVQVTFTIVTGDDEQTKARRVRATGIFPGKVTSVALLLDADAGKLAKSAVVKMLDSIH
jgi:hypothetical protein